MSNYVVIARFDEKLDKKLINLRKQMEETGYQVPKWPPHITIAAYENLDETLLCEWTSKFVSRQTNKLEIALHSMSVLPPNKNFSETAVLCLNPAYSKEFVDFYYSFHECYEEYCTGIGLFNSITDGHPIIHATIGIIQVNQLQKAIELIILSDIFKKTEITALEVYTYPMRLIKRFDLK